MQPPQLKPALAGTADVTPPAALAGPSMTYDVSSGKCENLDSNPCSCEERDDGAGTYSADYRVHQQRPDDMHDVTRRQSSSVGQLSVAQVLTSAAPLSSPPQPMAARTRSSRLPHVSGTSADRSASVSLPPAYPDRFSTHAVGDCPAHHSTGSSWWCCGNTCAKRTGEANGKVPPEGDGCSERFSPHRVGSALLSSTAETAPGYLLALIGVVTGVLLFLPWSSNPVHIALMVLSSVVGCVCGLLYWISERRWYRPWRHGFYDASGAAAASCSAGSACGWHVEPAAGSAAPRYHDHDAGDEVRSVDMCCCAGCMSRLIDRQHFCVVLPTVQLLLLGTFVLVSPQVMATWTAPMASATGRGGGAILADGGAGHEARYGATLYPVEAVWKTCLLHAWIGMRFSLPLLWSLLVGLVHMAVLLAQYQHAGPGTLLTLVVWMSVPLLCFAFAMCSTKPRPAIVEEQQQHRLLRGLASGGGAAGYSASYGAGVGVPLPPFVNSTIGRSRDALEATRASVSYSSPPTVTPAAPAPATQYSAHPSRRVVLPPPPVAAYSPALYAQMLSAESIGGSYFARLKVGEFGSLVRGGGGGVGMAAARYPQANYGGLGTAVFSRCESGQRLIAPQRPVRPRYNAAARSPAASVQQGAPLLAPEFFDSAGVPPRDDLIGLATPRGTTLLPQHGQARDLSAPLYSPSSPSQAVREARYEPDHHPISTMVEVTYPTTSAAAIPPSSEDGTHPSLPPPQASRQLAPPSRLSIVSSSTPSTMFASNLELAPQPRRQLRKNVQQAAAGEVEEAGAFRDDAVDSDGAAAAVVPEDSSHQETLQHRRTGSAAAKGQRRWSGVAPTAAAAKSMSAAALAADEEGVANGVDVPNFPVHGRGDDGEEWDGEPPVPAGASLEDACAPYLILDPANVIVDVGPSLCQLLGTTVDAILFRRLPDVLAWLDVVEREKAVMLVSAVAQPLRTAAAAGRGERRGAGAHLTRDEKAKKKGMKGRHSGAQDGMRDNHHDTNENCNAPSGAAKQLPKPSEEEMRDNVVEGAPVRRITLRGHCPYYVKASGSTRESSAGRCSRRPPFALCFDVWAERLAAPAPSAPGSWRKHRSSAVGGGQPVPTPFVIILRRPLLHGLCDALPLPVALVHPRTGEVLCWNRYAARLTGCTAYDMLGTPAYGSFVYEGLPGAATTAASRGGFSSTGRHLLPPPPSPSEEFASSAHRRQRSPSTAALSAAAAVGTVPDGEVASNGLAPPPVKSTSPTTAVLLLSSQQTTSTAFSPLHNARLQRQHGGAGGPTFVDQASPPPHAAGLYGTFTVAVSQQHRDTPLPGFFYVPCTRAAAALADVPLPAVGRSGELAMTSASGGGGARPSSASSTGGGPHQISSLQLPWSLAGRVGTAAAASGHADRLSSQLTTTSQSPLPFGVDGGGGGNKNSTSGVAVGVRCPRPPPPPPLAAGLERGPDPYDEAGVATAFETDGNKEAQGDGDEDVIAAPYCSSPVMVHGLLFRATLRPLRGILCSEEGGVVENQLGGPLRTSASAVEGEHTGGRGAEGNSFFDQPPRAAHAADSAAVEGEDAGEGQALARKKNMQAHGDDKSGGDNSGEALLSDRQPHHRHHRLHRTVAGARMQNSECQEDSGAEDQSVMDDDDDDDTPFDEDDLPKAMAGTMSGGLTFAATLEQLFATKAMACNFGLDKESAAGPRRSAASTVTTTATAASGALLSSELLPQYSLREALKQLAASESPLLLTFSEPPVYATACASAEALLQERRLGHRRVSSASLNEHGYSSVFTHANNNGAAAAASGGGCTSVSESYLGTPLAPFLRRQRPQVPALWGDGSASLKFVAAVKEAVDSYRESIEEDSSGYTDLLGLLSLSGGNGGCCPSSGYAARNSSSSLTPTSFGGAPDAAVTTAITAGAVRQLRLLKSLSDQLLKATAAYNRTRQSMSFTTYGLSGGDGGGGGVAARVSPSSSSSPPSLLLGLFAAPSVPDADAAHERHLHVRRPRSAETPSPYKDLPAGGPLGVSVHQSPFQPPPPAPQLAFTGEEPGGAHRRLQGDVPHRRQPGEPAASASTGGSGAHTGIYRDPNGTSFSVASEDATGVAPSAVGDSRNWALKEPPPPPHRGATRTCGSGGRTDIQDGGVSPVKSRPRHAAKSSTASASLKASRGRHTGARHGRRGGVDASTPAPSPPLVPLDAVVDVTKELRSSGYMGEISGSTPPSASPCGGGGSGRTAAAAPAATSSLNASTLLVAAGSEPAMSTPRPHAMGTSASALDVATPQTELHSSPRRCDTVVASGEGEASGGSGGAGEDAAAAGGVASRLATSPRYKGSLLLSPSLAAAEMGALEARYGTESRHQQPQHRSSPNIISGAGSGSGATAAMRDASPQRRSSAVYRRESSLDILPSAPVGSGSFRGNSGLVPSSSSVSLSAGAGAGGQGTGSPSPHPARTGSGSLNANATAAAAATAAVRSTPRRPGEGAVWAVLVSRDEATIPSCCISVNLGDEFRLGRSSKCTAVVSDSFVSSTQFSIVRTVSASTTAPDLCPGSGRSERGSRRNKAFTVTLYDRSANGTYVNVKKLGKDKSCVLRDKALITFRLSTSQFFLGFVFMLTDERGVPLDDRTGMGGGSGLRSLLDARRSPQPQTGRRTNASSTGGGGKESSSSQNTVMASPTALSTSAARRNTPRALSTPDNSSFASGTPNGSRRAGGGAPRSSRHAHRETIEWKIGEEMLGKGGNAEVYLGINLTNGQLIAVKRVRLPTFAHGSDAEQDPEAKAILQQYRSLQEEISVLSKATHPNIVQYYGSSQNSAYFNILLEFVPGGSLRHLLDNFGALSPGVILSYVHQALEGLAYLHRHNIVHSDFKAANILITEKGKVKLTDFGTARLLNRPHATAARGGGGEAQSVTSRTTPGQRKDDVVSAGAGGTLHIAGTLRWMDPALFHNPHSSGAADVAAAVAAKDSSNKLGGPTKAGDIWSVGCTMIEMMSGEAPWFEYDFESEEQIVNLLTYTAEPPEIPECPECPDLVTIAQTCLKMDPAQRPTCEELLRIVEEATARLQAQSTSPSVSPSREVSQQQPAARGSVSGAGTGVRFNSTLLCPQTEPGTSHAFASLTANPTAAACGPGTDDRRRAERVGRPSDSTPLSLAIGGDGGSSAPLSARDAASSTAL